MSLDTLRPLPIGERSFDQTFNTRKERQWSRNVRAVILAGWMNKWFKYWIEREFSSESLFFILKFENNFGTILWHNWREGERGVGYHYQIVLFYQASVEQ